jgi:Pretoxin HINT domain
MLVAADLGGGQDVVSCLTDPALAGCAKAALTVALVVGTGGEGELEVAGAEAAEAGAEEAGEEGLEDAADEAGATCGGKSFTAGTKVLLANGAAVPISQLKTGDKVLATSTKTGKTQPETVTAVLVHHDTDLYNLKIRAGTRTAMIDTTSNHLFWVPGTSGHGGRWVKAGALKYGTHLRTPDGSDTATVADGWVPRQLDGWMWDLTVPGNNDHDFYIDTTVATVLVHNDACQASRGSTGRTEPANLKEQLAMKEANSNPTAGRIITRITMSDSRWPADEGWVKMQQNVNGVIIHYVYNTETGVADDFKFK